MATKRKPTTTREAKPKQAPAELTEAQLAELTREMERVAPVDEDGNVRPVQIGQRGRVPNEMVTIFVLDGVEYQIPSRPSAAVLIKFQRSLRKRGQDQAVWDLLLDLLGQDALDALAESPEVTAEDVGDVFAIVAHIAFGAVKKLREAADPS